MIVLGGRTAGNEGRRRADADGEGVGHALGRRQAGGQPRAAPSRSPARTSRSPAPSLDASGAAGGGKVLIGGDTGGGHAEPAVTSIPQARLEAAPVPNATTVTIDAATHDRRLGQDRRRRRQGDGVVRRRPHVRRQRSWRAAACSTGNGGFVEVSGHQTLTFTGKVDLGAPAGTSGTLLLDPLNGRVDTVAGPGVIQVSPSRRRSRSPT